MPAFLLVRSGRVSNKVGGVGHVSSVRGAASPGFTRSAVSRTSIRPMIRIPSNPPRLDPHRRPRSRHRRRGRDIPQHTLSTTQARRIAPAPGGDGDRHRFVEGEARAAVEGQVRERRQLNRACRLEFAIALHNFTLAHIFRNARRGQYAYRPARCTRGRQSRVRQAGWIGSAKVRSSQSWRGARSK